MGRLGSGEREQLWLCGSKGHNVESVMIAYANNSNGGIIQRGQDRGTILSTMEYVIIPFRLWG